jgi:hypothetical protein
MGVGVNGLSFDFIWDCQLPLVIPTHCQNAEDYNLISTRHESLQIAKVHLYNCIFTVVVGGDK